MKRYIYQRFLTGKKGWDIRQFYPFYVQHILLFHT